MTLEVSLRKHRREPSSSPVLDRLPNRGSSRQRALLSEEKAFVTPTPAAPAASRGGRAPGEGRR